MSTQSPPISIKSISQWANVFFFTSTRSLPGFSLCNRVYLDLVHCRCRPAPIAVCLLRTLVGLIFASLSTFLTIFLWHAKNRWHFYFQSNICYHRSFGNWDLRKRYSHFGALTKFRVIFRPCAETAVSFLWKLWHHSWIQRVRFRTRDSLKIKGHLPLFCS